jgi:hypothetical protein
MNKRGQLTIFIIIAILVVAGVSLFFVFRGDVNEKSSGDLDADEVFNYVRECMESVAEESIYDIGKGGGYSNGLENYYLVNGENNFPSKEQVQDEISKSFNENLYPCIEGLSNFTEYKIENWTIETKVQIREDKVKFNIEYPLTVLQGESYARITKFRFEVNSRIDLIYGFVEEYIDKQVNFPNSICLGCIPYTFDEGIFIDVTQEQGEVKFSFFDNQTKLNDKLFEWVFINKY